MLFNITSVIFKVQLAAPGRTNYSNYLPAGK